MSTVTAPVRVSAALPRPYRVISRRVETADTVTLALAAGAEPLPAFAPGQFAMLAAYGIGEVPISLSALPRAEDGPPGAEDGRARRLTHTLRAVGAVTRALYAAGEGAVVGVRGPFGTAWDLAPAVGHDLVIVAGGIGLAPLRPLVQAVLADRSRFGDVALLVGARTPADLLYTGEFEQWSAAGVRVDVTVDRPAYGWDGHVGVVPALLPLARFDPARSTAFVCGPEVMMRFTARALLGRGLPAARLRVSLERTMRCGCGWCGHCQLGPLLLCRDGPVVGYDVAGPLLTVREL